MSTSAKREVAVPVVRSAKLRGDTTMALLALLPPAMALASRSAPAVVTLAAGLATSTIISICQWDRFALAARATLSRPLGRFAILLAVLAVVSLAWSQHKGVTLFALGEALLPALAAFVLWLTVRTEPPRWFPLLAAAAFAFAAIDVVVELSTKLALRSSLGFPIPPYSFNRTVITLLVLYWPLSMILLDRGQVRVTIALGGLLLIAVARAHSGAAMLGLAIAGAIYALTQITRKGALALVAALLLAALVVAPVKGDLAAAILPDGIIDLLAPAHARDRIEIWQSFGEVVRRRPILGTGFGTSVALAFDPVAAEVPEERRVLLGVGHPHDQFLQIWTELGLAGAVLALVSAILMMRGLAGLSTTALRPRLACLAAVTSVALVGHGAWQGWWIAVLGAALVLFHHSAERPEHAHGTA